MLASLRKCDAAASGSVKISWGPTHTAAAPSGDAGRSRKEQASCLVGALGHPLLVQQGSGWQT